MHKLNRSALRAAVLDRGHLVALAWVALIALAAYVLGLGPVPALGAFLGWALVTGVAVVPFLYGLDVDRQERREQYAADQLARDLRDELREREDAILRADHERVMQAITDGGDSSPSPEAAAIRARRDAELDRARVEAREARRARLAARNAL